MSRLLRQDYLPRNDRVMTRKLFKNKLMRAHKKNKSRFTFSLSEILNVKPRRIRRSSAVPTATRTQIKKARRFEDNLRLPLSLLDNAPSNR